MKFYSTNKKSPPVDFREATINGQAPDKGLYFPERIPSFDIKQFEHLAKEETAFRLIGPYTGNTIPENVLREITRQAIDFPIPLVRVTDDIWALELFHGPTLAFKDVGARFMSRCLSYFVRGENKKITVLVATSGDTGGAVANGFHGVEGVEVILLYPSGRVSPVQEKQLTTYGDNIYALEVKGSFDDCQAMVKQAFADNELHKKYFLTSANSINVARWLPQQFYYFFAWQSWQYKDDPPVFSVPSGNLGNLCAGLLGNISGLPASHFIGASNANDVLTGYLKKGRMDIKPVVSTLSNAMDVADPSNLSRIIELFTQKPGKLSEILSAFCISDEETIGITELVYKNFNYLLDPHGAVAYLSLQRYLEKHPGKKGIFLETAHPVKFPATSQHALGRVLNIPISLRSVMEKEKRSTLVPAGFEALKEFLMNRY
jgi:threonine synthase